jgi:hypothetical protein
MDTECVLVEQRYAAHTVHLQVGKMKCDCSSNVCARACSALSTAVTA